VNEWNEERKETQLKELANLSYYDVLQRDEDDEENIEEDVNKEDDISERLKGLERIMR